MGIDVSTKTIGISLVENDGSDFGKIIQLTHINPRVKSKIDETEKLFLKKKIFETFIKKYRNVGIDRVIIESPLLNSNNIMTCGVLLRFNGMISDAIYNVLGIVPEYVSSYDARKYSFPELMAVRKYGRDGNQYDYDKIVKEVEDGRFVLFGSYSWEVDKKVIIQDKVSKIFPEIKWLYDRSGEMKKENYDATDSYVCVLSILNKEKYGELEMKVSSINIDTPKSKKMPIKIDYDVEYWDRKEHRITYAEQIKRHVPKHQHVKEESEYEEDIETESETID